MNHSLKKLWSHFRNKRTKVFEASLYSILNKIFDIAPPVLIGLAVDTVVKGEESFVAEMGIIDKTNQIYALGILTFFIWAFESFFEFMLKVKWRHLAQEVQHSLRIEGYNHLQKLQIAFFEDQNTGNLTTILNDDVNQLERFLDIGANEILQVLTTALSIGIIFFIISPSIALLSFTPIPFIIFGSFYFQNKIAPRYSHVREEAGLLASILTNNLSGIATIKSYVAQDFESERLSKQSLSYSNSNKKAIILSSSFSPIIRMVVLCGFLFTLILGGIYVFEGSLEVGAYSTLIFLVQRLLWPMTRLGVTVDLYQRAMASTTRILNLLNTPIDINDGQQIISRDQFHGKIEFNNVRFQYSSGDEIIKDVSFQVQPSQTVAFVGTTGSGKSTILKLLLRFYDITHGEIKIDGIDLTELKQDDFRRNIGFVSQDTYLFHGSVRDNILYGSFEKSDKELIEAAKMAEAHDFITNLPKGYDTIVGERGQKLSGGQRQRLSIARALIKNPKLFILDEATSAVDNETEAAIQRSLEKITKTRTTVMVAHRLSTIKDADMIFVLEAGHIVERGNHEQLLSNKGIYKALWDVQTGALKN